MRVNCNECIKKYGTDIYGWSGSLSVLTAYTFTTLEKYEEGPVIPLLNLYGSLSIGYLCYRSKVWQALSLEVAWFILAFYSLIND